MCPHIYRFFTAFFLLPPALTAAAATFTAFPPTASVALDSAVSASVPVSSASPSGSDSSAGCCVFFDASERKSESASTTIQVRASAGGVAVSVFTGVSSP